MTYPSNSHPIPKELEKLNYHSSYKIIVGTFLEFNSKCYWKTKEQNLEISSIYQDLEEQIEGIE